MNNDITNISMSPFEKIKKINEYGSEYWSARDLMEVLGYSDYRNFLNIIRKAIIACENSNENKEDHFGQVNEMVDIGSNAKRERDNYYLSRYACYLIVQNADSSKKTVAFGQTYFAIQTRKQEISEEDQENQKRLLLRNEMKTHNLKLADAAKNAGVIEAKDYAVFQNYGYMGLYGGLTAKDIHRKKELNSNQSILDHMGSTELAANLFRATQAEEKLRREKIKGKEIANRTHFEVGEKVRQTIVELGGTMPEDLPCVESIKDIEKKQKKLNKTSNPLEVERSLNKETEGEVAATDETIWKEDAYKVNEFISEESLKAIMLELKNQGRMILYTNLSDAKFMLSNSVLTIVLKSGKGLSQAIINKSENLKTIKDIFGRNLNLNIIDINIEYEN